MKKLIFLFTLCIATIFTYDIFAQENTWSIITSGQTTTWVIATSWSISWSVAVNSATWFKLDNVVADYDVEFKEALSWMYLNGLTSFGDPSSYRPFDKITRQEAAKVIWRFAKKILEKEQSSGVNLQDCLFSDSVNFSPYLAEDIYQSCTLGIFKWDSNRFYPLSPLTKAQTLVVLVRMFDDRSYSEETTPRFKNYYERAYHLGLVQDRNLANFERAVTRYEIALMVYRFNIKFKLFKQAVIKDKDELVTIVDGSVKSVSYTGVDDKLYTGTQAEALIDISLLTDPSVDRLIINTTDAKYTVRKRELNTYGLSNNNYVRYGDLYTADDTTLIWVATFAVINGYVSDAYIRLTELGDKYYEMKPSDQPPYFIITQKSVRVSN